MIVTTPQEVALQDVYKSVAMANKVGHTSLTTNLQDFFPRVFDVGGGFGPDLAMISGYGPQFAAFGLLTLIMVFVALFKRPLRSQAVYVIAAAAVLLFIIMLFLNQNANSYRILSFLPMALLAYAGVLLYQGRFFENRRYALVINTVLAITVAWNMVAVLPPFYTNLRQFAEFVEMDSDYRTSANYTSRFLYKRPSLYRILQELPASEPIAYVSLDRKTSSHDSAPADTWIYPYYDRAWQRHVVYMKTTQYLDCETNGVCRPKPVFVQALHEKGISFVSTCKTSQCLKILDNAFFELAPGFYYVKGAPA